MPRAFVMAVLALLTCETRGEYTHCWNEHGQTVTTVWHHNGRDYVIPDNRDHAIPTEDDPSSSGRTR